MAEPTFRRVVLAYTTGPYAGLNQIVGHIPLGSLPAPEAPAQFIDPSGTARVGMCVLTHVTPRMLLYREVATP